MVSNKRNKDEASRRVHGMKIWLIYDGENFVAYADNKEIVDDFISSRKNKKYNILKTKYHKLPDIVRASDSFYRRQLTYFVGYNTSMQIPLIQFELELLEFSIREMYMKTTYAIKDVLTSMKYLKIDEDSQVKQILLSLMNLIEDNNDFEHEVIYDDIIEIDEYIDYFINN